MTAPAGVPEGYRTLSPYVVATRAEELVAFVSKVFGTSERGRMTGAAGAFHFEVELGDSVLMIGEGSGSSFPAKLHVYVEDADAVYEHALAEGATSVAAPHDTDFEPRARASRRRSAQRHARARRGARRASGSSG